jgi:DNA mismatch repair protein MutL
MNRVRLLPDQVANQIAAGEVVERPASVVKELVENALDAEARRVQVEIGAGGRSMIRVIDDGWGMSRDDALLCLERHATSKIRRAEDLASISTMGFRGEALPSIASVSRFLLTTREREDATGEACQVVVNGGKIQEVKTASSPPGTTIEVRQLFFNLPARRKFLRGEETERAHIQHYLTLAALAHPDVSFVFVSDQRTVWQLPAIRFANDAERSAALRERLRQLHGADTPMLAVDFRAEIAEAPDVQELREGESGSVLTPEGVSSFRVWGYIGAPGVSRGTREEQHVFVNRRPVENRGLNFALMEGYHNSLMKGRYPVCCLFIEIDPAAVDVNIHPAKREVKFREEMAVRRLVAKAVREALVKFHGSGPISPISPMSPMRPMGPMGSAANVGLPGLEVGPTSGSVVASVAAPAPAPAPAPASTPNPNPAPNPAPNPTPVFAPGQPVPLLHVPLRLVGVIGRLYVVLESDRGLVLLDQHAAHERILFEQMLNRMEKAEQAPSQGLLLPETVELAPRDAHFVRQNLETLSRLGVGLREFGERTFLLDALPPFVRSGSPKHFALSLIDELKSAGTAVNTLRLGEDVVAKTVCRHAVKANDPLSGPELENLVKDLRQCAMPYTCPHGRPTLIEMNWRELEKKFGRTG